MRTLHRLKVLLRSWFRSTAMDDEFSDELRFHLDQETQANLDAGLTASEARRAAHLALGHVGSLREQSRDSRSGALMSQLIRDSAYGVRLLKKAPAFALTAVVIVALGIGATTAIFSVVYGVALRPLPYADPARLVSVWTLAPWLASTHIQVNAADHRAWQAANHAFEDIALVRTIANFNLTEDGEPERLFGARASSSLFKVLGVAPALGRVFTEDEDEVGREGVVVLSDSLWRRRFGADRSIIGRTINLSGLPHIVIGVMKPDFQYPGREFQLWTPLTIDPDEVTRKVPGYNFVAVARLKPGVSVAQAQAEMSTIAKRLETESPATNRNVGVEVIPLLDDAVGAVRWTLYVMLAAVSCLLLIACLNLASLLGARAASRSREFGVRLALGASRARLALQAMAEVAPILVLGGALGVAAAAMGVAAFVPLAPPTLPRAEGIAVSLPVLLVSIALLAVTGFVGGLLPAVQAWRSDLTAPTKEENRSTIGGRSQTRTRSTIVVVQIALVLPLLVGAGLLVRSFIALVRVDPGFRSDNVLSLQLAVTRSKYPKDRDVAALHGRLIERIGAVPGVTSVGMVNRLPLAGVGQTMGLEFESPDPMKPLVPVDSRSITLDYFRTMGIPLVEGRIFTDRDGETSAPVGIVDQQLARAVWPGQSALGRRFRFGFAGAPWVEIVGVVGHVRHDGLDVDPRPQIYQNYLQRAQDRMALVVRGGGDVRALIPAILQAVKDIDREQPVYDVRTMEDVVERSTAQRWLNMTLVTTFAAMALLLASVGVYGVLAYGVARQIREFGLRIALGARPADVMWFVLRRGGTLAVTGAAIGLAVTWFLTRAMASLLYGVGPGDLPSFIIAAMSLVGVALAASYLPARRASRVEAITALRAE